MTIFVSAFLLFSVEPLIARRILPWFGGSAAVWSTCLVFYQTALLAGYLYARTLTRYLTPFAQTVAHVAVVASSLLLLPIGPGERWRPEPVHDPSWRILFMLTATIGLPFLTLSATSPLLQAWLARPGLQVGGWQISKFRRTADFTPYRLFAVSNLASLTALLAYPSAIEPWLGTQAQRVGWSILYVFFVVLCAIAAWLMRGSNASPCREEKSAEPIFRKSHWFALAACGSMLLLSITNHLDQNVAAVPLMWVLPLAVYLLSFVFSFASGSYNQSLWMRLLAFALGMLGYAVYNINSVEAIQISLPVLLSGLYIGCFFCHAELNRLRPSSAELTDFYLVIAGGGAAGAIFVGLLAPRMFSGVYELPVTLLFTALLALASAWLGGMWPTRLLWIAVSGCMAAVVVTNVGAYRRDALSVRRSFYGSLRVVQAPHAGPDQERILFHGTIEHGAQFLLLPGRARPTAYYGPDSGAGILLRECFPRTKRVGIIGLGVGTLAAYGQAGDEFVFYEINSQVAEIAQVLFFYLRETRAGTRIVIGDGRLSLERDPAPVFDVLVLDAFSGDAIPVHLLTRQALALYLRHLKPDGVLAFHVSNDFLDLAPVVQQLARDAGYRSVLVHNHPNQDEAILPADWVLVTNNQGVLANPAIKVHAQPIAQRTGLRLWTDDYSSLLQVFKTPELRK